MYNTVHHSDSDSDVSYCIVLSDVTHLPIVRLIAVSDGVDCCADIRSVRNGLARTSAAGIGGGRAIYKRSCNGWKERGGERE
jgi:hypothetical protein